MNKKYNKGITLVALVITIIVLLILAGITITFVLGQNGIIGRAQESGKTYGQSETNELNDLNSLEDQMIAATSRDENVKTTFTGNSVSEATIDRYEYLNFSMSHTGVKQGIVGNSKFGNVENGVLTINQSGWYYISSNMVLTNSTGAQIYNGIFVNDLLINSTFTQGAMVAPAASATIYANVGDKIKVQLACYNASREVHSWNTVIYKMSN